MIKYNLKQHGRASLDFLASLGPSMANLIKKQSSELDKSGINEDTLLDDLDERSSQVETILVKSSAFRSQNLLGEWHSEHHARIATAAFKEIEKELKEEFDKFQNGKTSLKLNPSLEIPKYWRYPIHRTTGGWDGHEHMGFIHGELIHRKVVGKAMTPAGGTAFNDINADRLKFASAAPRRNYKVILEIGCASGAYTSKLSEVFPHARILGCDISASQLMHAQRNGNVLDYAWELFQADGRNTGLEENSVDLFTSYIILHELPVEVITDILKEGFRVLNSGGELFFGDVAPYKAMNKMSSWRTDYLARFGGEPFWRGSATIDMVNIMKDIGFTDIKYHGMEPKNYPWVTYGRKP